jgi:S-DNA-T family DNA segregation ATPase FtsK/SpoIIIE
MALEKSAFMSRRKRERVSERASERAPLFDDLSASTKQAIAAVLVATIGAFFLLSLLNYAGPAGAYTALALITLFGGGAWLAPLVCLFFVYALLNPREDRRVSVSKIVGSALLFLALLGGFQLWKPEEGGYVGWAIGAPLTLLFGPVVAGVLTASLLLIGIFLFLNIGLALPRFLKRKPPEEGESDEPADELSFKDIEALPDSEPEAAEEDRAAREAAEKTEASEGAFAAAAKRVAGALSGRGDIVVKHWSGTYVPPSLSLLGKDKGKPQAGDVKNNALIIKRTLLDFGINVEMDTVECGPTVTRYSLKPAQGVRLSRIVALQQELQSALRAVDIRIEAPIPGKALVGIEVPNIERAVVGLASLLANPEYTDSPRPLLIGLGKDVAGGAHFANIARMPHVLIAGTTGSGKSAFIHNIILSLLFRNSPEQLRFLMVDPKRVELTLYQGIPHLLTPVITDPKSALKMLKWAANEMNRRYDILQTEKIQNIDSYHEKVYKPAKAAWVKKGSPAEEQAGLPEPLPYIVIVMDELADLMLTYPKELEALIVRLAQLSRAIGIHLILATQRPSVNIITGIIKANITTRIALNVASQVDSRTILDQTGAEKLVGRGDMLFVSSDSPKPLRLQSAYVSEDEIKSVVAYLKDQDAHQLDTIDLENQKEAGSDAFMNSLSGRDEEVDDELLAEAKTAILEGNRASTSYLQRRLRIGYSRASRLMDVLEEQGVIGPQDGARPRAILIGRGNESGMEMNGDEDGARKT